MRHNGLLGLIVSCACLAVSGVTAVQAQCTLPYTLANGQIADASQVMANFNALANCLSPGGSTNSVQYNNGGTLGGVTPLNNGQLLIGSTGAPPQAHDLTAGSGINITNGAGSVSIAATGTGPGNGMYGAVMSATPTSSGTGLTTWLNQGSATVSDSATGICIDAPSSGGSANVIGRYMAAPSPPYTFTALIAATRNVIGTGNQVGIGWYDGSAKLHVLSFTISLSQPLFQVGKWTNVTTLSANDFSGATNYFSQPLWMQIKDDGTTVSFAFSQDGKSFLTLFSVAKASGFLGATGYSNIIFFVNPQGGSRTLGTLMSWAQG
jgi:hypothetical protein